MRDRATIEAELDKLRRIRGSGTSSVSYDGHTTEYRTDAQLAAAIGALQSELAALDAPSRPRIIYPSTRKGL